MALCTDKGVMSIPDLSVGSPAQTGLTHQTKCQCCCFAVGHECLRHLALEIFYDQTPDSDTCVVLTCGGRCSSRDFFSHLHRVPATLILRNYCPQVPPDSHGMPDQLS